MLQVSQEMFELADRARNAKTKATDIGGGTFTITNAGAMGGGAHLQRLTYACRAIASRLRFSCYAFNLSRSTI